MQEPPEQLQTGACWIITVGHPETGKALWSLHRLLDLLFCESLIPDAKAQALERDYGCSLGKDLADHLEPLM